MLTLQRRGIVDEYRQFNFARASTAFDSRGRLYYPHNARFEPGKFGQAVLIEEGTTNLVPNADSFSGWTIEPGMVIETSERNVSLKQLYISPPNNNYDWIDAISPIFSIDPTKSYTFSCWIRGTKKPFLKVLCYDASDKSVGVVYDERWPGTITTTYQKFTFTVTPDMWPTGTVKTRFQVYLNNQADYGSWVRLTEPQVEQKPYATTFVTGTRAAETLTVPTAGVLDQNNFDICGWFVPTAPVSTDWARIWVLKDAPLTGLYYRAGTVQFAWNNKTVVNTGVNLKPYDVLFYSVSKTGNNVMVRVAKNGGQLSTFTLTTDGSVLNANEISFGSNGAGSFYFSGIHGPVRISNIARSDEEIAATYASNQPLQADQYTTLLLNFDGPDAQRAAKTVVI